MSVSSSENSPDLARLSRGSQWWRSTKLLSTSFDISVTHRGPLRRGCSLLEAVHPGGGGRDEGGHPWHGSYLEENAKRSDGIWAAAQVIRPLMMAVAYLHERHVMHRVR